MTVRIIPATLRDLSYIAANLRTEDRAEIDCQLDHWSPALLALTALQGCKRCSQATALSSGAGM
ncbi:hypothetical protein [Mesorhizobium sp. M1322]|uniref:hypothetical protein n=1 Tax=Mesorhizobium sp. M1322 TaxID=2957081 RepID=UPI003336E90F